MSEAQEALGLPKIIQWRGKPYFISPMDHVEVIAAYESYLEDQAWDAIERAKARRRLSPESYQDQADGIRRDIVAGVYAYGSRAFLDSIRSMNNQKRLVHFMLTHPEGQRDLSLSLVDEMYADPQKLKEILAIAFPESDPNAAERAPQNTVSA